MARPGGASLGVAVSAPYADLPDLARGVEGAGFDAIWVAEIDQESIVQATLLAHVTERIDVGTAITVAFPRSPTITAMAAWDLGELSSNRFVIGLGSQVRRLVHDRFSADFDPPAQRMAEYVQAMRTVWAMYRGEDARFEGEHYRVVHPGLGARPDPGRPVPRVYVAAVGPVMTRVAATHADGLVGHAFTSLSYLDQVVLPRIEEGLGGAGRDRDAFTLAQAVICAVGDDREQVRRDARRQVGFYGTTPNYRGVFEANGDGHLVDALRRAWITRDPEALADAVPDDVLDRYAIAGPPDEVRARLDEYAARADHLILATPWYQVPRSRMREQHAAMLETLGE